MTLHEKVLNPRRVYESPKAVIVALESQGVLCGSEIVGISIEDVRRDVFGF